MNAYLKNFIAFSQELISIVGARFSVLGGRNEIELTGFGETVVFAIHLSVPDGPTWKVCTIPY